MIEAMITFISNYEESITILNRYRAKIPVTEDIIKAISGHPNCYGSIKIMKFLLDQRGDEIIITEEIAKTAARNNKELIVMLLRERKDEVTITEAIIQAAAGNDYALELMELLLDQ